MNLLPKLDPFIIIPVIGLIGFSISTITSTVPEIISNQIIYFIVGLALFYFFSNIDFNIWKKFDKIFYFFSIFLLALPFFFPEVRGSHRWINLGITNIQPSEVIKPFILVIIASLQTEKKAQMLSHRIKNLLIFLPIFIMIFYQPDLGSFLVYFFTLFFMYVASGLSLNYFFGSILIAIISGPLIWPLLKDYQRIRIMSFINPYADPTGAGYNALQSIIAIGSGRLFGMGLGKGTQSHLLFLPEHHTDFIFASITEELGLVGGLVVMILYFLLLLKLIMISFNADNKFGKLLVFGVFIQIFIQVFINIGMNLGVLPITGITLPLISAGGSSIISTFIGLGMVVAVSKKKENYRTIEIG